MINKNNMEQIDIRKELDIIIKQANAYIDYLNTETTYSEFGDRFLRLSVESDLNPDIDSLKAYLWSKQKSDGEDFLQSILDFESIMKLIDGQGTQINNEIYRNCKEYWDQAQNNLKARNSNNYLA
tara:strand:+ start:2116 stop:2490 length:375 start_codon:yes stop_codon:yes gene_type:complete